MGGALPDPSQRVVAVGGAANTVHPATGYQMCRLLASSTILAAAISAELKRDKFQPDAAAAAAHAALWPRKLRLQRDFQVYSIDLYVYLSIYIHTQRRDQRRATQGGVATGRSRRRRPRGALATQTAATERLPGIFHRSICLSIYLYTHTTPRSAPS